VDAPIGPCKVVIETTSVQMQMERMQKQGESDPDKIQGDFEKKMKGMGKREGMPEIPPDKKEEYEKSKTDKKGDSASQMANMKRLMGSFRPVHSGYGSPETSGLSFTVGKGSQIKDFNLSSKGPG
jgi:hypothetical protein